MNPLRMLLVRILMISTLVIGTRPAYGQGLINKEAEIKAGIVALLGTLCTWPSEVAPGGEAAVRIGILGGDPFQQGAVNHLDAKTARKNVEITRFEKLEDYRECHILIVSQPEDLPQVLTKTKGQSVLIITQSPGLAAKGSMVNLITAQNRIQMEINPEVATRAGLTIDARIYNLPMVKVIR